MKRFTQLYLELDQTTRTSEKLAAIERYFREAPAPDAAWGLFFLTGRRIKRAVNTRLLRAWTAEAAELPSWLIDQSHHATGDLAEALALVLPDPAELPAGPKSTTPAEGMAGRGAVQRMLALGDDDHAAGNGCAAALAELAHLPALHVVAERFLAPLARLPPEEQHRLVYALWRALDRTERFILHKLILGDFRVGAAATLVSRALAQAAGVTKEVMAHRLMGDWSPAADDYRRLLAPDAGDVQPAQPYPFFLAHPLEVDPEKLGPIEAWQAEWKWDGIRAQILRRGEETLIWSRGEELITERFPEIARAARRLPAGTVLDGEVLAWRGDAALPFALLQRRIGRKTVAARLLAEAPAAFMAFDLLEADGADLRSRPLLARRRLLEEIVALIRERAIRISPLVRAATWPQLSERRAGARDLLSEGLMLKRLASPYGVGRPRGDWWKWKVAPFSVDAVLMYAQPGSGRRASLFTDYTFGLWQDEELLPVAKAYSGLSDEEIRAVDAFVRRNTTETFGPVRAVRPELVFELHFERVQRSKRHKSGVAVRFPRIHRWRKDKRPEEADSLAALMRLADEEGAARVK